MNQYEQMRALGYWLAPDWSRSDTPIEQQPIHTSDWQALALTASEHLISPMLYAALQSRQILHQIPDEVAEYLNGLHDLNRLRNIELWQQALHVIRCLNHAGIEPIVLKGMAALATGLYADFGHRVIGDIDLLFRNDEELSRAYRVLAGQGYGSDHPAPLETLHSRHRIQHLPPLVHTDFPAAVELHGQISKIAAIQRLLPVAALFTASHRLEIEGAHFRVLADEDRLLHNFLHAAVQDYGYLYAQISLRQLLEFSRLQQVSRLDWSRLHRRVQQVGFRHAFESHLMARQFLLQQPWPLTGRAPSLIARLWWWRFRRVQSHRVGQLLLSTAVRKLRGLTPRHWRRLLWVGISG